ncbi:MAG: ABC transporter ATP-binding protein [Phycisphaeraceae bacterium]|nr:ABC transporter ATP-binding protein [Phycisphaeraceae bacterium]
MKQAVVKPAKQDLVVEAVALTKVFHDFWHRDTAVAVDGIDFHIRRHEIFGLLGPNGSGKSTTIKMILGLLRRSKGVLRVFGREPDDVAVKRRIGFLPEESYLYRFLNPVETLDYYGKLFGLNRRVRRRRSGELLSMVGLDAAANRTVGEFSKGMARRLGLAQALINDPEFLILDEPTSGLDPVGTRQVKDLLLDLGRRGKTILLSSHLLSEVEDVCDRMVILYGGRVRAEGTTEELLEDTNRTVIQAPRLKPETITRIEQVIRESEGASIERVQAPRQKLEELFISIVERARQEQVATSGAKHGGPTADFLLHGDEASEESEGGALIESLASTSESAPVRAVEVERPDEARRERGVRDDVLRELTEAKAPDHPEIDAPERGGPARGAPPKSGSGSGSTPGTPSSPTPSSSPSSPRTPGAAPPSDPKVDRSFIEGLLGDRADDEGGSKR